MSPNEINAENEIIIENETFESSNKKRRNNTNMIELDDDQIINCEGKLNIYYY